LDRVPLREQLRLFAPAKINLGLEVIGKRPDGYHDVVTVLETVSLFDVIDIAPSGRADIQPATGISRNQDLVCRAVERLSERTGVEFPVSVRIQKRIPVAAGLGGGSSDAGTILHALGLLFDIDNRAVHETAASLGSDVPFFLHGGVALATGTGTDLEPLSAHGRRWYVLVVPGIEIPGKTAQLYSELNARDFSDGSATRSIAAQLVSGTELDPSLLANAFTRPLWERAEVRAADVALRSAGATAVIPSGAGPAIVAPCTTFHDAARLARKTRVGGAGVYLVTSVGPNPNQSRLTMTTPDRETKERAPS
jgi:4-diphosphocytidyl-2-C-methyl-D-erythritol kinase